MTNRREFLQTGVAVSALPLAFNAFMSADAASAGIAGNEIALYKAIFDERYAESRIFAGEVGNLHVPVYALKNGDVTELWYDELDLAWRKQPLAIAGSTQFGPMFVLERLAGERGMGVAMRVEHQVRTDGTLAHVMSAPRETLALALHLSSIGMDWPAMMAVLVTGCRATPSAPLSDTIVVPGARPVLAYAFDSSESGRVPESIIHYYTSHAMQEGQGIPFDGPLFSWVIAPAAHA